jgi:purine-binding chemotaxis protein CheW
MTRATALHPHLFCVFEIANERFALPVQSVTEILPMATLTTPPGLPGAVEGFLNRRGRLIPVLRLSALMNLEPVVIGIHTPLVLTNLAGTAAALLADRVLGVESCLTVLPTSDTVELGGCVDGQFVAAGRAVHVLSADRLLQARERQHLAELQAAAAERLRLFASEPS